MLSRLVEVFIVFLRLGLTSFGGPVAHLGFFHHEFVVRRKWISPDAYGDLVALCQMLPGPASSQVGMALGLSRAGIPGALAAWLGFTLPSAIMLVLFGLGLANYREHFPDSWLHGLKLAAVAVVAQALWAMGTKLCPDKKRATIAVAGAVALSFSSSPWVQVFVIAAGGCVGLFYLTQPVELPHTSMNLNVSRNMAIASVAIFFGLLVCLPIAAGVFHSQPLKLFDSFFRAGSLVFGGGHVVLPLLQSEVVPNGWILKEDFMAGYGAAQAIPGPLFTFTAYLGAVSKVPPSGWTGAAICLIAAFLPSFLLVIGILPFWEKLRTYRNLRFAMQGINAAVVGLLLAALYNPVWTSAIYGPRDFGLALIAFLLLVFWKVPSWAVVALSALAGGFLW